jgi:hypothetical protein
MRWPIECIAKPYLSLMQAQVIIDVSGGVAEAIHRGTAVHIASCRMEADPQRALALINGDLFRLIGHRHGLQPFLELARSMLEAHWPAVDALARALIRDRRIEGDEVEAIIDMVEA